MLVTLKDSHDFVRKSAAESLGTIGDVIAVEPLIVALKDDSYYYVRMTAAMALMKIGAIRAVEPLIVALKDSDSYVRKAAAEALNSLKWQPVDDKQRALRAIALGQWQEVTALGAAAVEPLMSVATLSRGETDVPQIIAVLEKTLKHAAADIAPEDLYAAAGLDNLYYIHYESCGSQLSYPVNCAQVRQLARQELIRRGLPETKPL